MKLLHLGLHQDTRLAFPHSVVEIWSLNGKRRLSVPWRISGWQLGDESRGC